MQVTGKWTAKSGGAYTDATVTTGDYQFTLPAPCKQLSGTTVNCEGICRVISASIGFATMTESDGADGGCVCQATVDQKGAPGLVLPYVTAEGNYTTSGNVLTMTEDETKFDYCVSGNTMTWGPRSDLGTMTGTVVFQKEGTTGSGGSGGGGSSGGTTGSGGARSGGATGAGGARSGGATGSGGARTGGATSSGGARTGGATGQGGSAPAGGTIGTGGSGSGGVSTGGSSGNRGDGPCDIYGAASNTCVAAYSMVRALTKTYSGPLFQVRSPSSNTNKGTGGTTTDIPMLADGYADTAAMDAACGSSYCTVSVLYDQSGNKNDIKRAPKGNTSGGSTGAEDDYESPANKGAVTAGGHKVYSLYMNKHDGYRTAVGVVGKNMPRGTEAQGIYELADGTHAGTECCWDFGNVTTDPTKYGIMNTLFFGIAFWGKGAGSGPWFMADFEAGVWAGGCKINDPGWGGLNDSHPANNNNPSLKVPFAFGIQKTEPSKWALRMADAQTASDLTTAYEGCLPKAMDNLGGIVLGVGGDNSNNSFGTFYEGAIVKGYPAAATELDVFKNVKAAGYTK